MKQADDKDLLIKDELEVNLKLKRARSDVIKKIKCRAQSKCLN